MFQSPMGIGITSNSVFPLPPMLQSKFQSPMGIGITSNCCRRSRSSAIAMSVSIPNGDRHYLEPPPQMGSEIAILKVSIPNGDRHYLELRFASPRYGCALAVSIPNGDRHYLEPNSGGISPDRSLWYVSIPNGDRHYLVLRFDHQIHQPCYVSIPNGDRHYLERSEPSSHAVATA